MEELPEMNINEIDLKLKTEWADWDDREDGWLHIRKIELMHALQKIEADLTAYHSKIAEMIAKGEALKTTRWACGHVQPAGPGDEYAGADPCDTCLLEMKVKLLKLSRLLSDKDMRAVYGTPIYVK